MFASRTTILLAGLWVLALAHASHAIVPTPETLAYMNDPGRVDWRALMEGERLTAFYGTVLAENPNPCGDAPCTTTDGFVQAFLDDLCNEDAFGVNGVLLGNGSAVGEKVGSLRIRNDKFEVYTYLQMYHCAGENPEWIAYHNTVVQIPVLLGDPEAQPPVPERIGYVAMRLIDPPSSGLCGDSIDYEGAWGAVLNTEEYSNMGLSFSAEADAARVIYEAGDGTLHRAWRFRGR